MHLNLHMWATLSVHGWARQNPVLPPSVVSLCAHIVLSVCRANLIGLLGCFTCSIMNGKHTTHQGDVLRRKQTPTDGFNIQQMNSRIFHTSTPDGPNEIEMQTRQTAHALCFTRVTRVQSWTGRGYNNYGKFPKQTIHHFVLSRQVSLL